MIGRRVRPNADGLAGMSSRPWSVGASSFICVQAATCVQETPCTHLTTTSVDIHLIFDTRA